jgi:hypothetical protein
MDILCGFNCFVLLELFYLAVAFCTFTTVQHVNMTTTLQH